MSCPARQRSPAVASPASVVIDGVRASTQSHAKIDTEPHKDDFKRALPSEDHELHELHYLPPQRPTTPLSVPGG